MPEQVARHDVVANCAAHTAVDKAEEEEGLAFAINAVGAANLARAAAATGASMVQISTDYVFAGDADSPYAADAPPAPVSAYGRTKVAGEWAVRAECPQSWIVRTAWLYGAAGPTGFPKAMKRLAAARDSLTVVSDQVGQPTWTRDLAEAVVRLVEQGAPFGAWHGTGSGQRSWFDFARATFEELGLPRAGPADHQRRVCRDVSRGRRAPGILRPFPRQVGRGRDCTLARLA